VKRTFAGADLRTWIIAIIVVVAFILLPALIP